jgi:hypothetical protein
VGVIFAVIASEAKQSGATDVYLFGRDCFVAHARSSQ